MRVRLSKVTAGAILAGLCAGCAYSGASLVGVARAPVAAGEVRVYDVAPPAFDDIAAISASIDSAFLRSGEHKTQRVIDLLKARAARLGANGIVVKDIVDSDVLSVGTNLGTEHTGAHGDLRIEAGGGFGIFRRTGTARAIFVPVGGG